MQKVYLGITAAGGYGYFTNGYLAWSLTWEQFNKDATWHRLYCKRLGFEFDHRSRWDKENQ